MGNDALIKFAATISVVLVIYVVQLAFRKGSEFPDEGLFVMRYSKLVRSTFAVCTLMCFAAVAYVVFANRNMNPDDQIMAGVFACLGLLCAYLVYSFSRVRIAVFHEGIAKHYVYGAVRFIPWEDIQTVKSRFLLGMVFIGTGDHSRWMTVNHNMDGMDVLFFEMRRRLHTRVYGMELDKPLNNVMHIG